MDVFDLTPEMSAFFAAAAHKARRALGADPPATRRMEMLREALALAPDSGVPVPEEGWGRLAEVIRSDRPLEFTPAYHDHLDQAGAGAARALAERMIGWGRTLLDLGGGLGTYARAFVERGGSALVIERPEVVARAKPGVDFESGDLFAVEKSGFDLVLLCNVLHLYGEDECARLCARARQMGRIVVVKDLDRATPAGVWFSLNMALFTPSGAVHSVEKIVEWLGGGEVERMGNHVVVRT
jgi:hypothetical protein